ncbi:uncharacterized protein BDZ99DRAFT_457206 [Mytilinidion resinicola]|uniref:Uncharacterized protein n=1 Tax=Mytilinidion resinicola TaxID=574789 RepID=A0A6A6Z8X3_9PEZI|nr:uncharacterized protein BDZ99DRAFT_457206 [Mytilinidion resinicola]KAF2817470.1 hypothetical protein BDZ99DRAFT_457206 [Mytilinidion resinicola]
MIPSNLLHVQAKDPCRPRYLSGTRSSSTSKRPRETAYNHATPTCEAHTSLIPSTRPESR